MTWVGRGLSVTTANIYEIIHPTFDIDPLAKRIRIGDIIEGIGMMTARSPCWGLFWIGIAATIWNIWSECNLRFQQGESRLLSLIIKIMIKEIDILFDPSTFKASHWQSTEAAATHRWLTSMPAIVDHNQQGGIVD